jgi:hypothetical protein
MDFIIENSLGFYLIGAIAWIVYNTNKTREMKAKRHKEANK